MSSYQLALKCYSQQDHVSWVVEEFHQAVDKFVHEVKTSSPSTLKVVRRQLDLFYQNLSHEVESFRQITQSASFGYQIKPYTEKLREHTQQINKILREHYSEWSREEWQQRLNNIAARLHEFKQALSEYNLRDTLNQMAEVVLLDHFDNLGRKQKIQWARKIWHMLGSLILVGLYLWLPLQDNTKIWMFAFAVVIFLGLDIYRLKSSWANAKVFRALKFIMRKQEATRLCSTSFYMISCFAIVAIFPKAIAILAMLFLGFGDPIASIIGIKWGRRKPNKRYTILGNVTFFTVCFLITLVYPWLDPEFSGSIWLLALIGGSAGMLSERLAGPLDDNLAIPIFSASLLWLTLLFL